MVKLVKIAEQCKRFDDMAKYMKQLIQVKKSTLTPEERNLFSVAYKNVVGARLSAYRIISSMIAKQSTMGANTTLAKAYRKEIVAEQKALCDEVVESGSGLSGRIVEDAGVEDKVFYRTMEGDHYRYGVEVAEGEEQRNTWVLKANGAYQEGYDVARETLPGTHPIRLGLALNYSVFDYEVMNDINMASKLAKDAFDHAIAGLNTLKGGSYKDSILIIMKQLRDNLTLWTNNLNYM